MIAVQMSDKHLSGWYSYSFQAYDNPRDFFGNQKKAFDETID